MKDKEYSGEWSIPNSDISGTGILFCNDKRGIMYLAVKLPLTNGITRDDIDNVYPIINGKTIFGQVISLIQCSEYKRSSNISERTCTIYIMVQYVCIGVKFENIDEIRVKQVEFELSNILQWVGLSSYEYNYDINGMPIEWKSKEPIELDSNDGRKIKFIPQKGKDLTINGCNSRITLEQSVLIEIERSEDTYFEKFIEDINEIINMITIATGRRVGILSCKIYSEKNKWVANDMILPTPMLLSGEKIEEENRTVRDLNYLYYLKDIHEDGIFYNWIAKFQKIKPILNLFLLQYTDSNIPIEVQFLNLAQALESYHSRFIGNNADEYKQIIQEKIDANDFHKEKMRNALIHDRNNHKIYFCERLSYLMTFFDGIARFPFHFITRNFYPYEFCRKITDTRNFYTHYDESLLDKIMTGDSLIISIHILNFVLKFSILYEMGFSYEYINGVFNNSMKSFRHMMADYISHDRIKEEDF